MSFTYKGFFRYKISSGGGGIGISVVAFKAPGGEVFPWRLADVLNDDDISGALYRAVRVRSLYLVLPSFLRDPGETEHKGKFHDLRHLQLYGKNYKGSLDMSFSIEKHSDGKFISMYSLRDGAATVDSVDLINQSYVWYTSLTLDLPNPILLADGNRVAGGE